MEWHSTAPLGDAAATEQRAITVNEVEEDEEQQQEEEKEMEIEEID